MRFFMLYSNQYAVGNKPIGIGSLAAVIRNAGHAFELFDCTALSVRVDNKLDWNLAGVKNVELMAPSNPERMPPRREVDLKGLADELLAAIEAFKPDIIGLSALTDDFPLGLWLMRRVKAAFPRIPVIAGGVHATVDPAGVLAHSCFDMVCVGEGELVVLDIAERIDQGRDLSGIKNLWIRRADGSIEKNAVRPYVHNLDELPFPDWTPFGETAFYKPFRGFVYKYGDFEMSRGCPYKCSYCINVQLQEIYKDTGTVSYHREKSIPRVIAEIKQARDEYGIEFLKFWDETFLLMSKERLEEFGDLYSSEIGIPYVIETTAQSITEHSAAILKKTNCRSASLGLETGSAKLRKGILSKPTNDNMYERAFDLMESNGIQKVSFNMLGLPGETQLDVFRTIAMNRLVRTDTQSVGIFYPYKGTPIRDMLEAKGEMSNDFEFETLDTYDFNTFTAGNRSIVHFEDMDSRMLNRLWLLFSSYAFWPVALFPLVDHVKNNDSPFAAVLLNNIQAVTYFKKYKQWPPEEDRDPLVPGQEAEAARKPVFGVARMDEFAALLVENWRGPHLAQAVDLLDDIRAGRAEPEVAMPENPQDLKEWLFAPAEEDELRTIRQEMRTLAKTASKSYR